MKNLNIIYLSVITAILLLLTSCEIQENFEYQKSGVTAQLGVSAWEFIQANDSLEMLENAINLAQLEQVYSDTESKTFIAPSNNAFKTYLNENSYESLNDVPIPILRNALNYHITNDVVLFTDPEIGDMNTPVSYDTRNGQSMFLSYNNNYQGIINQGTSNQWTIVTSNLQPTNGAIHVVNSIVFFSAPASNLNIPDSTVKTDSIFPVHDTYINGGSQSGNNFGSAPVLRVKNVTGNGLYDRKAYFMFDLNEFDDEGIITDMRFEISVRFTAPKGVNLNLFGVNDTLWTESSLNFNNATLPSGDPIVSIVPQRVDTFIFDITDYYTSFDSNRLITLVLDGEPGSDETNDLASKENPDFPSPTLIATLASGENDLVLNINAGFSVNREETFVLNQETLEITGAGAADIILTVDQIPENGWLIRGSDILNVGDRLTQQDINARTVVYINNGLGSEDIIRLSARDRTGSNLDPFDININIQ